MGQNSYSFDDLKFSSQLIRDLVNRDPKTEEFGSPYSLDRLQQNLEHYQFDSSKRKVLSEALSKQNAQISLSDKSKSNIESLNEEKTYTVTTGHQLNLLTGPLYSIYKISETIALSRYLNNKIEGVNIVPIFWMATEDADFEEINHLHLYNRKFDWNKKGQEEFIAGRIKFDQPELFDELKELFNDPDAKKELDGFFSDYTNSKNLADATRSLINSLFGDYGLVIIDGDDPELKEFLKPVLKQEFESGITKSNVESTNKKLEEKTYHNQVHVRDCNLFYIHDSGKRERIVKESGKFSFNGRLHDLNEVLSKVEEAPQYFSPNALLRPVYQESILPNLVYIGGGGEIAYWLQIKELFSNLNLHFPLLKVRDSFILLNERSLDKLADLKLDLVQLQKDPEFLIKELVIEESEKDLQLTDAEAELLKVKSLVLRKTNEVDKSMEGMVEGEFVRMIKGLEKIEAKLIKAEKAKFEQRKKSIENLRNKIFPENGFQERYENFIPYFIKDPEFIQKIVSKYNFEEKSRIRIVEI